MKIQHWEDRTLVWAFSAGLAFARTFFTSYDDPFSLSCFVRHALLAKGIYIRSNHRCIQFLRVVTPREYNASPYLFSINYRIVKPPTTKHHVQQDSTTPFS
jgi:hypothetical protein